MSTNMRRGGGDQNKHLVGWERRISRKIQKYKDLVRTEFILLLKKEPVIDKCSLIKHPNLVKFCTEGS